MEKDKLLPCPFCGNEDVDFGSRGKSFWNRYLYKMFMWCKSSDLSRIWE